MSALLKEPVIKSDTAFRTIGEAAAELDVPTHVLRFWETKFRQIQPVKRAGGRRYYRPEDMLTLHEIQGLLHTQGFTIKGAQSFLKENGKSKMALTAAGHLFDKKTDNDLRVILTETLHELKNLRALLGN